jgi:hypothetical protein
MTMNAHVRKIDKNLTHFVDLVWRFKIVSLKWVKLHVVNHEV